MEPQGITWPDGTRPAQLVDPASDDALRQRQGLDDELHRERCRMPSAGDQFLEEAPARNRLVQMPRLRIELAAESLDRIRADDGPRLRCEHRPGGEILEIRLVHCRLLLTCLDHSLRARVCGRDNRRDVFDAILTSDDLIALMSWRASADADRSDISRARLGAGCTINIYDCEFPTGTGPDRKGTSECLATAALRARASPERRRASQSLS